MRAQAILALALLAALAAPMLHVACAQGCATEPSLSPESDEDYEPPLVYPIGVYRYIYDYANIKLTHVFGYPTVTIRDGFTHFFDYYVIVNTTLPSYFDGKYRVLYSTLVDNKPVYEMIPVAMDTMAANGSMTIVLGGYYFAIRVEVPTSDDLNGVLLDIAPFYTLLLYDENGTLVDAYTAKTPIIAPSLLLAFIDELAANGTSVDAVEIRFTLEDGALAAVGDTAVYAIQYSLYYTVVYNGSSTETFEDAIIAWGTVSLVNGTMNVSSQLLVLDLTEYNGVVLARAGHSFVDSESASMRPYAGAVYSVSFTNSSGGILYDGDLTLVVYGDWLIAAPGGDAVGDIIYDAGSGQLLVSFRLSSGPYMAAVYPNGTISYTLWVNETYLYNASGSAGFTPLGPGAVSFIPVVWATPSGAGSFTVNQAGYILVYTVALEDTETGDRYLLVAPLALMDPDALQAAPPLYDRLYNGETPYLVPLRGAWNESAKDDLAILSWHAAGFLNDTDGVFGGEPGLYPPLLAAKTKAGTVIMASFDIVDYIVNGPRVNATWIDPYRLIVYRQAGLDHPALEYVFSGGQTVASSIDNLAYPWIKAPLAENVNASISLEYRVLYLDDYLRYYFSPTTIPVGLYGTSYYYGANPPTMNYSLAFNALAGKPVLALTVAKPGGGSIPAWHVTGIVEAAGDSEALDSLLGGAYPSVADLALAVAFDAVPVAPTDVAVPVIAPGIVFATRQGYAVNGVLVIGATQYMFLDSGIGNYSKLGTVYNPASSMLYEVFNIMVAEAQEIPACDAPLPGLQLCFNTTYEPGSVLVAMNGYDTLGKLYVYDSLGRLQGLVAYYWDPDSGGLFNKTVCDGDCQSLQESSPCLAIEVPYVDPGVNPYARLAAVKLVFGAGPTQPGGGTGGIAPPPPPQGLTLPEPGQIAAPSMTTPRGVLTVAMFLAFYVFYNQRMSHAQALTVAAALTGVLSTVLWGPVYLAVTLLIYAVGLALYYVLGK